MKPLVLIAEDEPHIVESLTFLIERAGLRVAVAVDGAEALKSVRELKPDLMILDVMMRHQSGFEVLKIVRGDPVLRNLKVLMLTAKGQEADRETAMALGADKFVTKPFSNKGVVADICSLLGIADSSAAHSDL